MMLDKYQIEVIIPKLKEAGLMDEENKDGCIWVAFGTYYKMLFGNYYCDGGFEAEDETRIERNGKYIGQYHLGTILQWINENREGIYGCDGKSLQCWNEGEIGPNIDIQFEGKPPMERTEKQNKELSEFMTKVDELVG